MIIRALDRAKVVEMGPAAHAREFIYMQRNELVDFFDSRGHVIGF